MAKAAPAKNTVDHSGHDVIEVIGAREHNLKDISISFPRNKLVVITGISGSGKSSLAFDTIYAPLYGKFLGLCTQLSWQP